MVKVDDRDLYQMLISELRYAIKRDNHLAPGTCCMLIKTYLPKMDKQWQACTAKQLAEESLQERMFPLPYSETEYKIYAYGTDNKHQLQNDCIWEELLVFLLNYLTEIPSEAERYMKYLYDHMDYYAAGIKGIDWYSAEIRDKIAENANKK